MEMKPVQSSQIHSIGFDADRGVVRVRFHDRTRKDGTVVPGSSYDFPDCCEEDHGHLVGAESVGGWFGKHWRGRECSKVKA